jgi:hypothetical protein
MWVAKESAYAVMSVQFQTIQLTSDCVMCFVNGAQVEPSPCLDLRSPCQCLQRFERGLKSRVSKIDGNLIDQCEWGWHGTDQSAIVPICCSGFDTARRSGQACGRGEYFSPRQSAGYSHGFARGTNRMLVCLIIKSAITRNGDPHIVVDNPLGAGADLFCMPIAILSYGSTQALTLHAAHPKPVQGAFGEAAVPLPVPVVTHSLDPTAKFVGIEGGWKSPFQWFLFVGHFSNPYISRDTGVGFQRQKVNNSCADRPRHENVLHRSCLTHTRMLTDSCRERPRTNPHRKWKQDDGTFADYRDGLNRLLESHYESWKLTGSLFFF